ncbi:MAG: hypothetical protein AMJ68_05570 [Acidithiobacillales bacterium SG8_45]|jgi:Spy/CpxP family protein refolding chaperone|nr:MAG: hypothetical protein AMJ68_05570 [Acidithiobacillales bacterium SG8_45]
MNKLATAAIATVMLAGSAPLAMADSDRYEGRYEKHHGDGYGHHGYGHHGYGKGCGSIERMTEELNLDEKQVAKLRAIKDQYRPQKQALRDKYRANRKALRDLMDKDSVKESDIRKLADAQGKIKADMIVLKKKMKLEMRDVLTKEQRAKWKEMRESRRRDS